MIGFIKEKMGIKLQKNSYYDFLIPINSRDFKLTIDTGSSEQMQKANAFLDSVKNVFVEMGKVRKRARALLIVYFIFLMLVIAYGVIAFTLDLNFVAKLFFGFMIFIKAIILGNYFVFLPTFRYELMDESKYDLVLTYLQSYEHRIIYKNKETGTITYIDNDKQKQHISIYSGYNPKFNIRYHNNHDVNKYMCKCEYCEHGALFLIGEDNINDDSIKPKNFDKYFICYDCYKLNQKNLLNKENIKKVDPNSIRIKMPK